jgi:hypothetical protein
LDTLTVADAIGTEEIGTIGAAFVARLRGRPPYGYRVVEDERCAQMVVPDDRTAPIVRRIFREYLDGKGLERIAEGLTADGVRSPGAYVAEADGVGVPQTYAWSKGAVRSILVNQRYASHFLGGQSNPVAFQPIVSAEMFARVHHMFANRKTTQRPVSGTDRPPYVLRGMVRCADCNRLMQGTWNNQEPYYRCRVPSEYASQNRIDHPKNVYLREQKVLGPLDSWLQSACAPRRLVQLSRDAARSVCCPVTIDRIGQHLRALPEVTGDERSEVYRALGLRMTYSGSSGWLRAKAVIGSSGLVISGLVEL